MVFSGLLSTLVGHAIGSGHRTISWAEDPARRRYFNLYQCQCIQVEPLHFK